MKVGFSPLRFTDSKETVEQLPPLKPAGSGEPLRARQRPARARCARPPPGGAAPPRERARARVSGREGERGWQRECGRVGDPRWDSRFPHGDGGLGGKPPGRWPLFPGPSRCGSRCRQPCTGYQAPPRAAGTAVSEREQEAGAGGDVQVAGPAALPWSGALRGRRKPQRGGVSCGGRSCLFLGKSHPGPRRRMDYLHDVLKGREGRERQTPRPLRSELSRVRRRGYRPCPEPLGRGCVWSRRLVPLWEAGKGRGEREGRVPGAYRGGRQRSPATGGLWAAGRPRGALPAEAAGRALGTGLPARPAPPLHPSPPLFSIDRAKSGGFSPTPPQLNELCANTLWTFLNELSFCYLR